MSYQQPLQQYPAPGPGQRPLVPCPFCGGTTDTQICRWCGRDSTASRRPCQKCGRMALTYEPACWNCGAKFKSDMSWKVPLIILLFVLSILLGVLLKGIR